MSSSRLSTYSSRYGGSTSYGQSYSTSAPTRYVDSAAPTRTYSSSQQVVSRGSEFTPYQASHINHSHIVQKTATVEQSNKYGIKIPVSSQERATIDHAIKEYNSRQYTGERWGGAQVSTEGDYNSYYGDAVTVVGLPDEVEFARKKVASLLGKTWQQENYNPLEVDLTPQDPNRHHEVSKGNYSSRSYNKWGHKVPCTEEGMMKIEEQNRGSYSNWGGATVTTENDACYGPTVKILGTEEQVAAGKRKVASILGESAGLQYNKIELHPRFNYGEKTHDIRDENTVHYHELDRYNLLQPVSRYHDRHADVTKHAASHSVVQHTQKRAAATVNVPTTRTIVGRTNMYYDESESPLEY